MTDGVTYTGLPVFALDAVCQPWVRWSSSSWICWKNSWAVLPFNGTSIQRTLSWNAADFGNNVGASA